MYEQAKRYMMSAVVLAGGLFLAPELNAQPRPTFNHPPKRPVGPGSYRHSQVLARRSDTFTISGRLDAVLDGIAFITNPISQEIRRSISEAKEIPISRVPKRSKRQVLVHRYAPGALRKWFGKEVEAEVFMDAKGFFYLVGLREVRRRP